MACGKDGNLSQNRIKFVAKSLFFIAALFLTLGIKAQQITNIRVTQEVDNVIITYDLIGSQHGETFNIEVTVSDNSGQSFLITPKSLSGDLKDVTPGNNKKIIWNVLKDRDELTGDGFIFKLNAKSNNPASNFSANSGTFIDARDGEVYKWVKIGTQIWMAENLNATKYKDGTYIPVVKDDSSWASLKTGAYCFYKNDIANKTIYGALYNWYAVNTGMLCPMGWHVPDDSEWKSLIKYLGGEDVAGGKLKETGTTHWLSPNIGATNTSGFSTLPGGLRIFNGSFMNVTYQGDWWSTMESSTSGAWGMVLGNSSSVDPGNYPKVTGLSVRCMRN